jgi:hypothetical protein
MGWENSHLHLFLVGTERFGGPQLLDEVEDEARVTVGALADRGVKTFAYVYDLGDDWDHAIAIESAGPLEPGRAYPACVAGRRRCPPEDSGGPWGFVDILEAADPEDERHAEVMEWLGDSIRMPSRSRRRRRGCANGSRRGGRGSGRVERRVTAALREAGPGAIGSAKPCHRDPPDVPTAPLPRSRDLIERKAAARRWR